MRRRVEGNQGWVPRVADWPAFWWEVLEAEGGENAGI